MTGVTGPDSQETKEARLTRLVETYQLAIKKLCALWLRDAALAEDAAQETFFRAYRALDDFRGACSEKTWLTRIAINVCKNMCRGGWFRHVDRRVALESLPEPSVPFSAFDSAVVQAVDALSSRQRQVVLLYYYQDMTMKEIASALRIAPSNVSRRLAAAKQTLRAQLEGAWKDDG